MPVSNKKTAAPKAAVTRQAILRSAAALFADRGYRATSIGDITDELGLTKGSMYFHFSSKSALASEISRLYFDAWDPILEQARSEGRRGLDALAWISRQVAIAYREDAMIRAAVRLIREGDEIEADLPKPFVGWMATARAFLEEDREDGRLRDGVDVEDASWHIVATFFGTQDVSNQLDGRRDLERRVGCMWDFMLVGLREQS